MSLRSLATIILHMSEISSPSSRSNSSNFLRASLTITEDEERNMWNFLREKIQDEEDTIRKLDMTTQSEIWEEFKQGNNGKRTNEEYEHRFRTKMANSLHETTFGTKLKIELYYGLSIPIEINFLKCLDGFGKITLDDAGCISTFRQNDRKGLRIGELSDDQRDSETSFGEEFEMDQSSNAMNPAIMNRELSDFDQVVYQQDEVKYFEGLSEKKRKRRISQSSPEEIFSVFKEQDSMQFWIFLYQKIHTSETGCVKKVEPSSMKQLCYEFTVERDRNIDSVNYERLFKNEMAPSLHRTRLDTNIKIKLYYGLNIVVEENFLAMLRQKADVETDEFCRIQYYKDRCPDGLHLFEEQVVEKQEKIEILCEPKAKLSVFSIKEETDMFMFLLQNVRNPMTGKSERFRISSNLDLWTKFKRFSDGRKEPREYMKRFDLILAYSIHLTQFTRQMKLEICYGMNLHVDEKFLKVLKATACVETDSNGCIVKYRDKHEGGFSLGYDENQDLENKFLTKSKKVKKLDKEAVPEEFKKNKVPSTDKHSFGVSSVGEKSGFDFHRESIPKITAEDYVVEDSTFYDTSEDDSSDEYRPSMYEKKKKIKHLRSKKKYPRNIKRKTIIESDEDEHNFISGSDEEKENPATESEDDEKNVTSESDEEKKETAVKNEKETEEVNIEYKKLVNIEDDTTYDVVKIGRTILPRRVRKNYGKVEIEDKGPFFESKTYLENLKTALTLIDSPDLDSFHKVIDQKLSSNKGDENKISLNVACRLIESAIVIAIM